VLERDNFAAALATGALWTDPPAHLGSETSEEAAPPRAFDPARVLEEEKVTRPEDVVRVLFDLYVPGGVRPEARAKLVSFLAEGKPNGAALAGRVREAVHAVLTMPEFQLA
jgi:hypothetical protein